MAVPASLLVSSGLLLVASACVSTRITFVATFLLSFVFLERVLSPKRIDGFFGEVDAVVLGDLRLVRDAIRDEPQTAPIYAAAEERVRRAHAFVTNAIDGIERKARANLSGVKDAAVAAFLWLRLAVGVANLVATALMNSASEEARSRAPLVLRWRGVQGLRTNEEEAAPASKPGTTLLVVWIAAIVAYCAQTLTVDGSCSGIASFGLWFPCFAALCGFALMEAERVYLWGSYAIDTTGSSDTAKPTDEAGDAAGGVMDKDSRFAHVLGRPLVLASLAIYNVAGLKAARQAYLTPDDGSHGNVYKWRRTAMKVLAIDIAKVVCTYLLIDFYLGALLFVCLCAKAAFFLDRAIYLSDEGASEDKDDNQEGAGFAGDAEGSDDGNQDGAGVAAVPAPVAGGDKGSDDNNQEGAGLAGDAAGDAEGTVDDDQTRAGLDGDDAGDAQGSDDVGAENSSDIAACDHEEEEGSTTEEHSDVSDSEEQRREESDDSSSSSMDGWSFVGVDPMMPTDVNGGVDRKFRFFL